MLEKIVSCKKKLVEKKLLVEVGSIDEAKEFAEVLKIDYRVFL